VVAKIRHRLSVSKRAAQDFDTHSFNLNRLNDVEVKVQYQVKIRNRFAALENLNMTMWTSIGIGKLLARS